MKTNHSQSKIWGAVVVLSLLVGTGIVWNATAQGQYPNDRNTQDRRDQDRNRDRNQNRRGRRWDQYPNWGGSFQLRQTALNAGYNEGIKQGRSDRNKRNVTDYRSRSAYQKATKDYDSRYGDRELYRRYYREAYENGYDAGINGY
jgi:hypothetical protein